MYAPPKILKADLLVVVHSQMDLIYIVIDGFVHGFDPVLHIHLSGQHLGLSFAGETFDFFNKLVRLFRCYKLRGLNGIY